MITSLVEHTFFYHIWYEVVVMDTITVAALLSEHHKLYGLIIIQWLKQT